MDKYLVLGLMSGTSLDGLDIAACEFTYDDKWHYKILHTTTIPYSPFWKNQLTTAYHTEPANISKIDEEFGIYLGTEAKKFIDQTSLNIELIASHGHTIYHKPNEGITKQIGSGKQIKNITGIQTISNFREQDILLGGQGAPLVPIGDELLFKEYDFVLNLGGFSNISWNKNGVRKACDLSPCNILFNTICSRINIEYDESGKLARQGILIPELYDRWNQFDFFKQSEPKSLGREWFEENYLQDIQSPKYKVNDLLATASAHIADQISIFIINKQSTAFRLLCTGGGSFNKNLIKKIRALAPLDSQLFLPEPSLIHHKEALIFGFLGLLRSLNKINILASVTGALKDHCSGDIYS